MIDDPRPLRALRRRQAAVVILTGMLSACTAALQSPRARQTPVPTATRAAATPTPLPTLAHLPKLPYEEADLDVSTSAAPAISAEAPTVAPGLEPAEAPTVAVLEPAAAPTVASVLEPTAAPTLAPVAEPAAPVAIDAPPAVPSPVAGVATLARGGSLLIGPARIGEHAIGDMLLDTGAGATFLDHSVADAVPLPADLTASTTEGPDDREASVRGLRGLAFGGLPLAADHAFVIDLGETEMLVGTRLAGVVALSTLGNAPFTLDFARATLTVHAEATFEPPAGVSAEALRIDQGLPFVEATLADDTTVWLLLDSGSAATIEVWRGFAADHPGLLHEIPNGAATPDAPSAAAELRAVGLFGGRFDRVPVTIAERSLRVWQRARVVGRVGMGLLGDFRFTVHPTTERIWAERVSREP